MKDKRFFIKKVALPEPTVKKGHNKIKIFFYSLVILFMAFIIGATGYGVYTFLTTYGFQTPIILRSPIYRLKPDVMISPVSTQSGKTSAVFDVGAIADKIYTLESSNGKNDGCKNLGLYNGYGWRQNNFEWKCYSSHEVVRGLVIDWLTKNIKDGKIEQALCYYNQGIQTDSCTYAISYKSL